ncbi:MAG: hypothetical protein JWQ25_1793 [Daejeonella sp.]|nr:hypothetical protein [Daejeonella sp.]
MVENDAEIFYNTNIAAARTPVSKARQEIKTLAQDIREEG